jgi:SNF2 family DNA or RNA helicase
MKVIKYRGTKQRRKALSSQMISDSSSFNVLLIQYEFVLSDRSQLSKIDWSYVIVDEGHRMKNQACRLTRTLRKDYRSRHRLLLTGTPLQVRFLFQTCRALCPYRGSL